MIVDCFAGGGGASLGIERALGVSPDIAINHDAEALAMHEANHPRTQHLQTDAWDVSPRKATGGRSVELAWFSPDCRHFSKAKGGAPVSKQMRSLAWVVVRWARDVQPRIIMLENVPEFSTWGPLLPDGRPCPARSGWTFRRWWRELESLGYTLDARELRACDYGAPTIRKRLFIIARRDGQPIVWPEPTHGPGRSLPWRTAAECIDWTLPCPSIFARAKPLAEATQRRIAHGLRRYVLEHPQPFIVGTRNGERAGQEPRTRCVVEPYWTVTAKGSQGALVAPFICTNRNAEKPFNGADEPTHTITAGGAHLNLVAAWLAQHNGGMVGHDLREPVSTITQTGSHQALCTAGLGGRAPLVRAWLAKYYGTAVGQHLGDPLHSATAKARFGLVQVDGEDYALEDIGMRMLAARELYRAQGFDEDYIIEPVVAGRPLPKTTQIRLCGNSVCPPLAEQLVRANLLAARRRPEQRQLFA